MTQEQREQVEELRKRLDDISTETTDFVDESCEDIEDLNDSDQAFVRALDNSTEYLTLALECFEEALRQK